MEKGLLALTAGRCGDQVFFIQVSQHRTGAMHSTRTASCQGHGDTELIYGIKIQRYSETPKS